MIERKTQLHLQYTTKKAAFFLKRETALYHTFQYDSASQVFR